MLDNNYYNYRYTSWRTYSADARGKSADGSVNWYTAVTRDGRQWSHLCLRDIKVFKRRYALTMCVLTFHIQTNKRFRDSPSKVRVSTPALLYKVLPQSYQDVDIIITCMIWCCQ